MRNETFRLKNPIYDDRYEYVLKDHLGNNRVFFSDMNKDGIVEVAQNGGSNELLQQEHYYPFGLSIKDEWKFVQPQIGGVNAYQYNGKELNEDFGLNWNDYGARWYDASIARWNAVDPLAEDYIPWSGYNYVLGNPLKYIDPDGMRVEGDFYAVFQGKLRKVGSNNIDDGKQYHVKNLSAFSQVRNNLNAETTQQLLSKGATKEIGISIPEGYSSEGDVYNTLFKESVKTGKETGVQLYLDE